MSPATSITSPAAPSRAKKAVRIEEELAAAIRRGDYGPEAAIPSLRMIARDYGVHYNTVQSVVKRLSARGLVTRVKRRGVFVTDKEVSREAPTLGGGPRSPRIMTVGLMCVQSLAADRRNQDHEFVRSVESVAAASAGRVFYYDLNPTTLSRPAELAERCVREGIDGVIIVGVRDTEPMGPLVAHLQRRNIPIVVCPLARQSIASTLGVTLVDGEDQLSGAAAAQHLYDLGHRELAVVTYDRPRPYIEQRIAGFLAVCDLQRLRTEGRIIRLPVGEMVAAEHQRVGAEAFAQLDPRVTGVFCINDSVAAGLIEAASRAGRVIGHDLSVVGHDNDERYHGLQITTIAAPIAALGRKAVELLIRQRQAPTEVERVFLQSHLVWRRTSGKLRSEAVNAA